MNTTALTLVRERRSHAPSPASGPALAPSAANPFHAITVSTGNRTTNSKESK
jgi:hypothetical protein